MTPRHAPTSATSPQVATVAVSGTDVPSWETPIHEPMPAGRWVGFVLVWVALVVFTAEAVTHRRRQLRDAAEAVAC